MPRSQKLVAALGLAIVAYLVSLQIFPQLPEGGQYSSMFLFNSTLGLVIGWRLMGNRAPSRTVSPLTNGLTGVLAMILWGLFLHSCAEMISRALDRRYRGPVEAFADVFQMIGEFSLYLATPGIVMTIVIGAMVTGSATDKAGRLFG